MSFIFLRNRATGGAAFSPASLFASGEAGAWYEPSTTTCFTDTAGTTAATYGDAVARINDLSGNGNHATQATAAARPILARVPEGGRRNELSETDTLATQSVTVTAAQRTLSFTGTGTVTLTGASTAGPLVGTGAGDRVSLTFTPSAGSLTLTVLGTVTDAQLELGASATTYQSVADSLGYDITEAGVTSLEYLAFDGSDDRLEVPSSVFGGATIMDTFVGAEYTTPAGDEIIFGFISTALNYFYAPNLLANDVRFITRASTANTVASVTNSSGTARRVFRGLRNGDAVSGRQNGVSIGSTTGVGTSAYASVTAAIGARLFSGTPSRFFEGNVYSVIGRQAETTGADLTDTESYVAGKTGVTL